MAYGLMARSAPARRSLGTLVSSAARATIRSDGLICADSTMYMLVASLAVVAMEPAGPADPGSLEHGVLRGVARQVDVAPVLGEARGRRPRVERHERCARLGQLRRRLPPDPAQSRHDHVPLELRDAPLHPASPRAPVTPVATRWSSTDTERVEEGPDPGQCDHHREDPGPSSGFTSPYPMVVIVVKVMNKASSQVPPTADQSQR